MSTQPQKFQWESSGLNDKNFTINSSLILYIIIVIASGFLLVVFFFTLEWICHRFLHRHLPSNTLSTSTSHQPRGLHPTVIQALPTMFYDSSTSPGPSANSECSICLAMYENGDKLKVLPQCHHFFHGECVDRWLHSWTACPLCRATLLDSSTAAAPTSE
ncbi:hypothetical protein P3X46_016654 [Hevea brasiliensis]|uniref:RING-type E3 ubiquitin transferase n=1 Tax=Hevea brasiliensis TaxID=3981 RepID=A0ABQ9LZV7_HEVBR|nr:RING-H2 finger protein ATL64-like [Hevea brasiliensis]KAJ9173531.1 hypothetical protein P3X46_016654 [Hevea brasiliensis]